jgi:hypothetical protein
LRDLLVVLPTQPNDAATARCGGTGNLERPFLKTMEILGGFVVVEVPSMDEAVAMAAEWPSLASQPNATVQVREGFVRG